MELIITATWRPEMHHYPTLAFIDQAHNTRSLRFSDSPDAAWLELRARQLVAEYWSETAWLTGRIPEAAFKAVCSALEREQYARGRAA